MALVKEYDYDDGLAAPVGLIEDIIYKFDQYANTATELERARLLLSLNDNITSLKTWHPGYDYDYGTMPWERDDEEQG